MNYGFCLTNNSTDYRVVKLGVKPDSPLSQAKERQMQMFPEVAKNIEDHYYIFNVFYPLLAPNTAMEHSIFSPALFNALAIMHANERERKTMEITEFSISIPTAYGSGHSTLAVLSQISFELIAHLMILRASAEDLPTQPANLKQTFAQVYRHGQIAMDKAALVIATWTLARAREHVRGETWDDVKSLLNEHLAKIPEGSFSAETLSRIQLRILERESLVKKNGELFRLGELYGLLPAEMQDASRACFNHVLEQAGQHIPMLQTDPQALFALVLSLLIATSRSSQARPQLSTRLTHWVDFLVDQYPPSSLAAESGSSETMEQLIGFAGEAEAYNWAVQDGAVWLSEETGWLNADWLRWAVKVVDMEMVLIPLEPLQVLEADNPGMPKLGCLYVPQE
ncbi:hypothetical protein N7462_007527 [Penicillium macrosclerotiorum]|uniref:uncharacterized protein n=1 Tax=Penicillium macrosclerotiorum TaxID=303699 RepID=UPI0025479D6A|nr:uncharacterized protein N7462_007527 [Penicillium macrosclerotiorum]KAJ5679283.1 hypothetical protein N7462_007527 [Penicillium macrosclerotiorum]